MVQAVRTLFVHIGTHKTGTSSIQAFLRDQAAALQRCGIYVPHTGTLSPRTGHHNIAWELRRDPRFDVTRGTLDGLLAEMQRADARTSVISSEDFEYLVQYPEALRRFEDAIELSGFVPTYIIFFRDPATYAKSLYEELHAKHVLTMSFPAFVATILVTGKFIMRGDWCFYFDQDRFSEQWRRHTRGDLRIFDFEAVSNGEGLIPTFLGAIGAGSLANEAGAALRYNVSPVGPHGPSWAGWALRLRF